MLKAKRGLSFVLAVLMCVGMLSCFVLSVAPEASARVIADPYARVVATEVESGVFEPADNIIFVNSKWSTAPASTGESFDYTYGDGVTWGNGKTYRLTWKVNAFSDIRDGRDVAHAVDPSEKNDFVVVVAPGTGYSTGDPGAGGISPGTGGSQNMLCTLPSDTTDPTEEELMNVWFLGPQAGKNPVKEQGSSEIANNRSIDTSKEFVFASTFWLPFNGVHHYDGFAAKDKFKLYSATNTSNNYKEGLYLDNFYIECGTQNVKLFEVGAYNNNTNTNAVILDIQHTYFNEVKQYTHTSELYNSLQCGRLNISDCVFYNFRPNATTLSTATNTAKQQATDLCVPSPTSKALNSNFMGDLKGTYELNVNNNSFLAFEMTFFFRIRFAKFTGFGNGGTININGNRFDINGYGTSNLFYMDKNTTAVNCEFNFCDNYFEVNKDFTKTYYVFNPVSSTNVMTPGYVVKGNTFKWNAATCGIATSGTQLIDCSGNLFLDYENNVLPAGIGDAVAGYTASANVVTDIYASGAKRGGMRELFGQVDLEQSAVACYDYIVLKTKTPKSYFDGYLTVLLKDGETYSGEKFISFRDKDVQYLGLYADAECTSEISNFTKDDLTTDVTLYAKAQYEDAASGTTATVIYQVNCPTNYRIVCPDGATEYTFNGVTYRNGETASDGVTANFYQYIDNSSAHKASSAYNGIPNPSALGGKMTTIIVLAPGLYEYSSQGMGKAVCFVGPQFGVSPYDKELAKEGKFANGRGFDPTKEAVLKGTLNPAGDGSYGYMFDGIAFAGSNGIVATGTPASSDQYLDISIQNCVFATTGGYGIANTTQANKPCTIHLTIRDCGYDGTGVERSQTSATSALVNARANFFTMQRCAILNDTSIYTDAGKATNQRVAYVMLTDGSKMHCIPKRLYADFNDNVIYNSNRDGILYTLRETTTVNANFDCWKQPAELNVKNNTMLGGKGYLFGIQGGEDSGSEKFVKLTATGNNVTLPESSTAIISNYQTADYTGRQTYSDDSIVKNNIFATANNAFAAYAGNKLNVDDNYFGAYADGKYTVAPVAESSTGIVKNASYYIDTNCTIKNDALALTDNANFVAGTFDASAPFDGMNHVKAVAKGKLTKASFTAAAGCTVSGIYADAACTTPVTEISSTDEATYYVLVKKSVYSLPTAVTLSVCGHVNETRTDYTAPTCAVAGSASYKCDFCGATRSETIPATGLHTAPADWTCVTKENCITDGYYTKKCTVCGALMDEKTIPMDPVNGHNYQKDEAQSYPEDCMKNGKDVFVCEFCHDSYENTIPSTGNHSWVEKAGSRVEPTCTATGSYILYCPGCNNEVPVTLNKIAHKYTAAVTKEATCTEDGVMTYTCTECAEGDDGHSYTEVIPNNGGNHSFSAWTVTREANCTKEGKKIRICNTCGFQEEETVEKLPHAYSPQWTIDVQPTNDVKGEKSHHCVFCGDRADITDLGYCPHENTDGIVVTDKEATCTEAGEAYVTCLDCGYHIPQTIEMLPHSFDEGVTVVAATCTEKGIDCYTCTECGYQKNVDVEANGHSEGVWKTVIPATCTAAGESDQFCTVCNAVLKTKTIPATGHRDFEYVVTVEPTCTEDGVESYVCTKCGYVESTTAIKAIGHKEHYTDTVPATCTAGGEREYECLTCGNKHTEAIPATGHTAGVWVLVKPATTLAPGLRVKYCTVCGAVAVSEQLEQLNDKPFPFKDVANSAWYRKAIEFVYNSGLFTGTSATTFSPNATMTRGMVVTVLGRLSGIDAAKYTNNHFDDVSPKAYYAGYIEWARVNNIVSGTGTYTFQPDRAVNRQELCKILSTYAEYRGVTLSKQNAKVTFTDNAKIASWAAPYVTACQRGGLIGGYEDGSFRPTATATRAEVATIVLNFYTNYIK